MVGLGGGVVVTHNLWRQKFIYSSNSAANPSVTKCHIYHIYYIQVKKLGQVAEITLCNGENLRNMTFCNSWPFLGGQKKTSMDGSGLAQVCLLRDWLCIGVGPSLVVLMTSDF